MVAATRQAVKPEPKLFPDGLELPLPLDHKTWETMRLCPPLLATKVGCDRAVFIAQLHFRLETISNQRASSMVDYRVGICKHGYAWWWAGQHELWEENPFFSKETAGYFRRELEERGWIVTNNFHSNPFDRRKFQTLNYPLIAQQTGYNPKLIDLNRQYPTPPTFEKGKKSSTRRLDDDVPLAYSQPYETYLMREDLDRQQDAKEQSENDNNSSQSLQPLISSNLVKVYDPSQKAPNIQSESSLKSSYIEYLNSRLKSPNQKEKDNEEKNSQLGSDAKEISKNCKKILPEQEKPFGKTQLPNNSLDIEKNWESASNPKPTNKTPTRKRYDWEHEVGKPFPDLVRWRANTHYRTQGERWASSALSHAATEIIRKTEENPEVVYWMWQDFLEYAERSADNALAVNAAGIEPELPKCFHNDTRDTATIGAKLERAKDKVQAAQVARVEKIAAFEVAKLAALPLAGETKSQRFWRELKEKLEGFKTKYEAFRDKPRFLTNTIAFVRNTSGLIWTDDGGPAIDPCYIFDENDESLNGILRSSDRASENSPGCSSDDGDARAFSNQTAPASSKPRTQPEVFFLSQDVDDPWGDVKDFEEVEELDGIDTVTENVWEPLKFNSSG